MALVFSIMTQKCFVKKNSEDLLAEPDNITEIDTELDNDLDDKGKE